MFFWKSLALFMIQRMLAIWSLVPLPFLKSAWTALRHYQKTEEWVIPQWLGWSSHSFANELTLLSKPSQATFLGLYPVECGISLWILTSLPLTYCFVSHWIFAMRHQSLSFIKSWSQASWVLVGLKPWERELKDRRKKQWKKTYQGIPFTACGKVC